MADRRSRRPSPQEEDSRPRRPPPLDPPTLSDTPRRPTRGPNMPNTTNAPGGTALTGHQSTTGLTPIQQQMLERDMRLESAKERSRKRREQEKQQRGNESQQPSRDTRTNVSRGHVERRENQPQSGGRHPSQHPSTDPYPGLPSAGYDLNRYSDRTLPPPSGLGYAGNPLAPHHQPPVYPQAPQFVSPYQQGSEYPQQYSYPQETAYQRSAYQPESAYQQPGAYQPPIAGSAELQRPAQRSANRQHEYDLASVTQSMSTSSLATTRPSGPPPGPQPAMPSWEVNPPTEPETEAPKKRGRGAKAPREPYPVEEGFRFYEVSAEPLKPLPTEEEKKKKQERERQVKRDSAARSREKLRQEIEALPPDERDEREGQRLEKGREASKKYREEHGDERNAKTRERRFEKTQQAWETEERAREEARSMLPPAPSQLTAPQPSYGNPFPTFAHHAPEPQLQPLAAPWTQRSGQAPTSGISAPPQGQLGHRRAREDDSPSSSNPNTPRPSGSSKSHGKKHRKTK